MSSEEKAIALTLSLRGEATDILQALKEEEQEDYEQLIKRLDIRYGDAHLEQVYQTQLRNSYSFPTVSDSMLQTLSTQQFVYGIRDSETQQALKFARPKTLINALSQALELEAAKQASRS